VQLLRRGHLRTIAFHEGCPLARRVCRLREFDELTARGQLRKPDVVPVLRCVLVFGNPAWRVPHGTETKAFTTSSRAAEPNDAYGHGDGNHATAAGPLRPATSLPATKANRPSTRPDATPITGPMTAIISRGERGSGIDAIMAASCGWFAM